MFYAKDSGAKKPEDVVHLDLRGKNLLMVDNIDFLLEFKNLKTLDISETLDMYKPREMLEAEAKKKAEGNPDPSAFEFRDNKHHRDLLLHRLPTVEHLVCDIMLELYILDTREFRHFMPNLKSINKVPIEMKVIE
jgi:hypothetical protein